MPDAFFEGFQLFLSNFWIVPLGVLIGMFAHPDHGGNYDGAGWKLLGFEPRYVWQPPFGEYDAEEMGR